MQYEKEKMTLSPFCVISAEYKNDDSGVYQCLIGCNCIEHNGE